MKSSTRVGPWVFLPNVKPEDVVYMDLAGNWDEFGDEIPEWFQQWRGLDDWQLKLNELLCLELCPVLEEFTRRLFDTILPCGVLHCKVTHRNEPVRTWLVFRQRSRPRREYTVKTLAKSSPGDFYYIPEREGFDLSFIADSLVRRFFSRLADSETPVHSFAMTCFRRSLSKCVSRRTGIITGRKSDGVTSRVFTCVSRTIW